MRKLFAGIILMLLPTLALAQQTQPGSTRDPCLTQGMQVAAMNISTATTTSIIAPPASGVQTYICGMNLQIGASSTAVIEYGTGATCGTGLTAVTGALLASTNTLIPTGATQIPIPAAQRVCVLSTGTGGQVGWLTYVQFNPNT